MEDNWDSRRAHLLGELRHSGHLTEAAISAIGRVDRHLFVPEAHRDESYGNYPLPIGHGQTISQPLMVGLLFDAIGAESGKRILEIGTGCGYQAAVLAQAGAEVWSVEIRPSLAKAARSTLDSLGYSAVRTRKGNGNQGWPEGAPYHGILLTAAPEVIPLQLLAQLTPDGILVAPVGPQDRNQRLIRVGRGTDGNWRSEHLGDCRFVPMVGTKRRNPGGTG